MSEAEVRAEMDRRIAAAGGLRAWCRNTGLEPAMVSKIRSGQRSVCESVANACCFIVEKTYRRISQDA